jgi:hypothetical protein
VVDSFRVVVGWSVHEVAFPTDIWVDLVLQLLM